MNRNNIDDKEIKKMTLEKASKWDGDLQKPKYMNRGELLGTKV